MKKKLYYILSILLLFVFCGCGQKTEPADQGGSSYQAQTDYPYLCSVPQQFLESEKGYYYLKGAPGDPSSLLYYCDKGGSGWIPLCNKPQCHHNSKSDCNAWLGEELSFGIMLYEDHLYFAQANPGADTYDIYSMTLDGSDHRKVFTVPVGSGGQGTSCVQHRGSFYFLKNYSNGKNQLTRVNLRNPAEEEILFETDLLLFNLRAEGEQLLLDMAKADGFVFYTADTIDYQFEPAMVQADIAGSPVPIFGTLKKDSIQYYLKNQGVYQFDFTSKSSTLLFSTEQYTEMNDGENKAACRFDGTYYYLWPYWLQGDNTERDGILHILNASGVEMDRVTMSVTGVLNGVFYSAAGEDILLKTEKGNSYPGYRLKKADIGTERFIPEAMPRP